MLKKIRIWPKATPILNNEEGAVIIAALMVLVLLTIIGIASTNVSNTEVKIATHELIHQQNLYQAEGATLLALVEMEKLDNPKLTDPTWLWQSTDADSVFTVFEPEMAYNDDLWNGDAFEYEVEGTMTTVMPDSTPETVAGELFSDSRYFVVYRGVLPKEPLEIGVTKRYRFDIYGRCAPRNRGAVAVEIGYIKAF
jgi:type II secretory pathway pseudopilin PulG